MDETLAKAILRTKEYGRRFGVDYTEKEIKERLISEKIFKLKIQSTKPKNQIVEKKMKLAEKLSKEIGEKFDDVLLIGVTGSVAAGYPSKNSDIDLMVITRRNTLWLTRLILRVWVWHKGIPHRQYGAKERINEFCFNLWLEEDSLKLPKSKQNLKNAMDLILMKPILNKNKTYEKFVTENDWAKSFVANGYKRLKELNPPDPTFVGSPSLDKEGKARLVGILNWVVFWPQWWYMKRKIEGGLVDQKRAFFHPIERNIS